MIICVVPSDVLSVFGLSVTLGMISGGEVELHVKSCA